LTKPVTIDPMPDIENRKSRRFPSVARAKSPLFYSGDALLKDISVTGCCIECTMQVDVKMDVEYTITVYPEKEAKVGSFDLVVECKWIHSGASSCSIGFFIKQSPKKGDFLKYVDYLSWRHGNGSN